MEFAYLVESCTEPIEVGMEAQKRSRRNDRCEGDLDLSPAPLNACPTFALMKDRRPGEIAEVSSGVEAKPLLLIVRVPANLQMEERDRWERS
jgi:hypothetical protein